VQYRRFCKTIPPRDIPTSASPTFVLGLSWALVLVGLALGLGLAV
jgi:hypothetical protein